MMKHGTCSSARRVAARVWHALLGAALALVVGTSAGQSVSQLPLSVANVPGNLVLVPSVEWPTLDSVANLGAYDVTRAYVGYFDADKCYKYSYNVIETSRYFYPSSVTTSRTCSNAQKEWSGNYLNWAATQTIDPFRKALTGGLRVVDTPTDTWIEKARFDGNGGTTIYPNRRIPDTGNGRSLVTGATPVNWQSFSTRVAQLGNRMRFTSTGDLSSGALPVPFDPAATPVQSVVYEVSVRVKVCDSTVGLEGNCKQYSQGYKPEGLIQRYAARMRYSVFSYLNDDNMLRDGGVLRAKQKFVGDTKVDPTAGTIDNPQKEWSISTGVLVRNPDTADASASTTAVGQTIADSGVINYINKFGGMTTKNHKTYDPASELYYSAVRYLKNQGNVASYTALSGTSAQRYEQADGFPVISTWDDPMQYACQNNALLGIGDANTHRDKNLPGNTVMTDEPARPAEVSADTTVNVVTATQKVAQLEGISIATPFTGRENSAYIAGLAYDIHTKDMRTDLTGSQTASTYWVDVRENQILEGRATNQYWLATKYGGFDVPDNYDPYTATTGPAASAWSSGEILSTDDPRPRNFYVASEADKMVSSLQRAFASIAASASRSASSLASNSTQLDANTRTYQALFYGGTWRGELRAYSINNTTLTQLWEAGSRLNSATWSARRIYVYNPQANGNSRYTSFTWANLGSRQAAALLSQNVVDYLRGDRTNESNDDNPLRTRSGVLGDIVNSTPVLVGKPNAALYQSATFTGASSYNAFVSAQANRTETVYVGSNDGMLHGFNASTGDETYAFVPNAVILNGLAQYSDIAYDHRYFVDGEIAVADVYSGGWKTILVGTLGRGGPGVFALDVTDPANVGFLWEKSGTDIPALGKNIGRPVIAQVADGDWRVLIGNGPGTTTGSAQLVTIDLAGTVRVVDTGATGNNGLSAVLARDTDADGFADSAYAGDFLGNLWKISGLGSTPSANKLFQARDPTGNVQPITAAPLVGKDPSTATTWIFFGTGKYLGATDPADKQVQTWYGIKDGMVGVGARTDLVQRSILAEGVVSGTPTRVVQSGGVGDLIGRRGWYMDLLTPGQQPRGERMVVPNRFQGSVLIGTTRIPNPVDACNPSGTGFIMALDPFTGARLDQSFFDVNRDGSVTDADRMTVGGVPIPVTGVGFGSSPGSPLFVQGLMQVGLDDATTSAMVTQPPATQAGRMSWRELLN